MFSGHAQEYHCSISTVKIAKEGTPYIEMTVACEISFWPIDDLNTYANLT